MSCDRFSSEKARKLLDGKTIYLFGDSNIRALYKDLLWLLEDGRLIPNAKLKCKNEYSHANDVRLSNGTLHSGRNYKEVRSYSENPYIMFNFITRLILPDFVDAIKNIRYIPDVLVINSCVWDLTRWGSNGVEQYKKNLKDTFSFLKSNLPKTRIIWLTTLPPSFKSRGGFLTQEIEFLRNMLPWHIFFANKYASDLAQSFNIDVLDLHYNFRLLLNYHTKDGIHWCPKAMRHITNLFLTHIALCWNSKLPGEFELDQTFIARSQFICDATTKITFKSNEQKSEPMSVSHNTAINKSRKPEKKKSRRNQRMQSTAFRNSGKLVTQQNQPGNGGFPVNNFSAEPVHNQNIFSNQHAWYDDFPVSNFESNYQRGWQDPSHLNNLQTGFRNAQGNGNFVFKFGSQAYSSNGGFNNQINQGRIGKKSSSATHKHKLEDAFRNWINYG